MDVKYHFVTETVERGEVKLRWVPTTAAAGGHLHQGAGCTGFSAAAQSAHEPVGWLRDEAEGRDAVRKDGAQPRKTNAGGELQQQNSTTEGREQLQRLCPAEPQWLWRLVLTHPTSIRISQLGSRSCNELSWWRSLHPLQLLVRRSMQQSSSSLWREGAPPAGHNGRIVILAAVRLINGRVSKVLRQWWNGAIKWNWSMASREKCVAVGPKAGRSHTLGTWSAQQLLAASDAQLARMRGSALRAQGRALTKDGPCRLIPMLAMLNYHPSTTWKAMAGSAATLGRDCMVPRRQSEGGRGPRESAGREWQEPRRRREKQSASSVEVSTWIPSAGCMAIGPLARAPASLQRR